MDLRVRTSEGDAPDELATGPVSDRPAAASLENELAEAHARIERLEKRLASQARSRADLVHLVTHELRTPITVISGFSRLLQDPAHGELNEVQARWIAESLKACRRLDRFVGDLLAACPDSGMTLPIQSAPADLESTIRGILESLSPLLEERRLDIELSIPNALPRLCFDVGRIEQVLTNLLTNAIRYGRPGGVVRLSASRCKSAGALGEALDGAGVVEVRVEDDGPGVPEEDRKRIFEPYVRGDEQSSCAGLGIGLAICDRILAAHGGAIRVEEGELGGALFVFQLPCGDATAEEG